MNYFEVNIDEYNKETIGTLNLKNEKVKIILCKEMKNNKKCLFKFIFFTIIILLITKKYYYFIHSFENISKIQGINYLNRCLNSLNNFKNFSNFDLFNYNENPKITVIIPVYNCQKSIKLSLTSILNQKIPEFEIILINDNSNDNSSIIINEMKKYDNRIKVIDNHKNMGTLYSRSIGALNAKGKYIFSLDNDDVYLNEDIFEKIIFLKNQKINEDYTTKILKYVRNPFNKISQKIEENNINIAEKHNYDIVEFKSFDIPNYQPEIKDIEQHFFNFHSNNLILHQPKLGIFPISRNGKYFSNDFLIWGKCIKTKLYQMSVNTLGQKRFSIYNCWTEDISIIFVIFNLANSYIFVNKYGIFHLKSIITSTFTLQQEHKIFSEIYLLDIIIDFLKETENNKKLIIFKAYDILEKIKNYKLSKVNKNYLNLILQKILDLKYINQYDKNNLTTKFNEFIKY